MILSRLLPLAAALVSGSAFAATVAVMDSGVDYRHRDLAARIWENPNEVANNNVDDDNNTFVDDINGWNFAEGNNQIIDYSYLGTFSDDCYKFFEVQGKIIRGTATQQDHDWYDAHKADETFLKELQKFGNFVHGTHVSGISSTSRSTERIIGVKLIPTETPGLSVERINAVRDAIQARAGDPLTDMLIKWFLDTLVDQQVGVIVAAGDYVAAQGANVANGSFGVSYPTTSEAVKGLLSTFLGRDPTDDETREYTNYMIDSINTKCKEFVQRASNTLFVFAAGNDGTDNDTMSTAPANVGEPNVISVAASMGVSSLASFSNYGAAKVDVAAPGVTILSTIPGDKYLEMSGTSMAAPFVTEVAALVHDANPSLTAVQVKQVIEQTVDVKEWLRGKVKTSGVVNSPRAVEAATLSRSQSLAAAISTAKSTIADVQETMESLHRGSDKDIVPVALPSLVHF